MSVYSRQIAQAQRMIKDKGQAVTWRKKLVTIPNPAEPWKEAPANPATNDFPVSILFLRPGKAAAFAALIVGTDIPQSSVRGLMAAVSFIPDLRDSVLRNGVELTIKSFNPLAPNGEVILYDIEFN